MSGGCVSAAPTDCRVPDPSDKLDAKADGGFGNHRAGYSPDRLAQAEHWARKGGTLAAGEGLVLCAEIDRLRDEMNHARALLIDLKRYRDEAERSRPIIQAAQAYLDSGGNYTSWLALRQLLPLSPSSPYAT